MTKRGWGFRKNGGEPWIVILPERPVRLADQEVLVAAEPERVAVVDPERLDGLELAPDVGLEADEDQAAVDAVVLDDARAAEAARRRARGGRSGGGWSSRPSKKAGSSRGLARRMCAPSGHFSPPGSSS